MTDEAAVQKTAVIVEDDPDVRHLLVEVLEAAGFSTVSVGNGIDGVRAVLAYQPFLTTLDVNMPGIDGFEAARRIRAKSDTFIIMLTGLTDEADVVLGLGAGADEYIIKPFRPREFRARVEALMRRPRPTQTSQAPRQDSVGPSFPGARPQAPAQAPAEVSPQLTEFDSGQYEQPVYEIPTAQPFHQTVAVSQQVSGSAVVQQSQPVNSRTDVELAHAHRGSWMSHRDLKVNPETRIAVVGNDEVELTRTEFDLLATLMESKRRVRSKADLTLVLRGESYVTSYFVGEADKRAVEAHMTNLRRKLGDSPTNPRYIETVRGVGYRLTAEVMSGV
ncbi:DNA-binding response OmpR family regulator [Microbacterium endophyticum]|uniref:DNA-binding response OmpR family regulator n=1 Tax=Microbacterium endophyticum TaxID=1526412 RepID=A0A7W4YMG8_9MICO|nr:response regulator transcription factor [Microbacterium endophyticum]MBB2975474.1 DNA-binding response OmpR family regulator [Microbacterium endophyticum]NIK35507.1 DNA-binding response OmpR family regulator [Microbacterium endophyticum]